MKVKPWKKIGKPEIIVEILGKRIELQRFEDPHTKKIGKYYRFGTIIPYACIVLPLTPDNTVLAVKQYRHGVGKMLIELPGGGAKNLKQTLKQVAEEELFEESFGYRAKKIIQLNSRPLWFNPALYVTPFHAFLALGCQQTNEHGNLDRGEYLELVKIPLNKWLSMCTSGEIVDAKTLAVTLLALNQIGLKITR